MAIPLYNDLNRQQNTQGNNYGNSNPNLQGFMNYVQSFTNSFTGNAEQIVKDALSSNKITQAQFDSAAQTASRLRGMLK